MSQTVWLVVYLFVCSFFFFFSLSLSLSLYKFMKQVAVSTDNTLADTRNLVLLVVDGCTVVEYNYYRTSAD